MKINFKRIRSFWLVPAISILAGSSRAEVDIHIGQNFQGAALGADSFLVPPDADGAVGPNHYVQLVNGRFTVYSKTNGSVVVTLADTDFWTNAGIDMTGLIASDPRVYYDPSSQRWFASQIDVDNNTLNGNRFLIGISSNSDPSGAWKAVAFAGDTNGNFADFPMLGLDGNGVYVSANMFGPGFSGTFLGVQTVSIPKADLLLSTPTASNRTYSGLLSSDAWGFAPQPVVNYASTNGAETVLAVASDGTDRHAHTLLRAYAISNSVSSNAIFTNLTSIVVPAYNVPINPPQPDGLDTLDDGDSRISASVYQVGNTIFAVHGSEVGPHAVVRWYKIDAASLTLLQSGTISDSNLDLFYPSIAANSNGVVVIGFNGCSTNSFISSYAAVGETSGGNTVFGDKILLQPGAGNYEVSVGGDNRWGDYSAISVDPANPNHFWTIQEIPSAANIWSTQITELVVTPRPALAMAISNGFYTATWPTNANGFALQSKTNLLQTNWFAVTNAAVTAGTNFAVTARATNTQFFRLVNPAP